MMLYLDEKQYLLRIYLNLSIEYLTAPKPVEMKASSYSTLPLILFVGWAGKPVPSYELLFRFFY